MAGCQVRFTASAPVAKSLKIIDGGRNHEPVSNSNILVKGKFTGNCEKSSLFKKLQLNHLSTDLRIPKMSQVMTPLA